MRMTDNRLGSGGVSNELGVELRIFAAMRHQLAMRAALDDSALIDHQNAIGVEDRA